MLLISITSACGPGQEEEVSSCLSRLTCPNIDGIWGAESTFLLQNHRNEGELLSLSNNSVALESRMLHGCGVKGSRKKGKVLLIRLNRGKSDTHKLQHFYTCVVQDLAAINAPVWMWSHKALWMSRERRDRSIYQNKTKPTNQSNKKPKAGYDEQARGENVQFLKLI